MSLVLLLALVLGVAGGILLPDAASSFLDSASSAMLLALLFSVGIDMGRNKEAFASIRKLGLKILLVPLGVVTGSLFGGILTALLVRLPIREGLAISAGLGWYSLSGILLTEAGNPTGGAVSFLANVFREAITFIIVPFLAGHVNFYCAIAPAGATAMDTTLGVISKNTNGETAVIAFVSGVACSLLVPVIVPIFL